MKRSSYNVQSTKAKSVREQFEEFTGGKVQSSGPTPSIDARSQFNQFTGQVSQPVQAEPELTRTLPFSEVPRPNPGQGIIPESQDTFKNQFNEEMEQIRKVQERYPDLLKAPTPESEIGKPGVQRGITPESQDERYISQFIKSALRSATSVIDTAIDVGTVVVAVPQGIFSPTGQKILGTIEDRPRIANYFNQDVKSTGEAVARALGYATGLAVPVGASIKGINFLLTSALKRIPYVATITVGNITKTIFPKGMVVNVSRVLFSGGALVHAISSSVDVKKALDAGDLNTASDAAAEAALSYYFSYAMSKGWISELVEIHNRFKVLRQLGKRFKIDRQLGSAPPPEDRFDNAIIITPKPQAQTPVGPRALLPPAPVEPPVSPELTGAVIARESTKAASSAIRQAKVPKPKVTVTPPPVVAPTKTLDQSVNKTTIESLGGVKDSWNINHPSGASMEVTFTDDGVYVEQVRVPKSEQGKGIGSQLYERLGHMMKQRGIPGGAIDGNINGPKDQITHLRKKAAEIAGEGKEPQVYDLDIEPEIDLGVQKRLNRIKNLVNKGLSDEAIAFRLNEEDKPWKLVLSEIAEIRGEAKSAVEELMAKEVEVPKEGIVKTLETALGRQEVIDKAIKETEGKAIEPAPVKEEVAIEPVAETVPAVAEDEGLEPYQLLERHYGKPIEEITDEELDAFDLLQANSKNLEKVITPVDEATGSAPVVPQEVMDSIFRSTVEGTAERTEAYARDSQVAKTVDELMEGGKDPAKTAWSLVNDVNRFLDGQKVDIAGVRNELSRLAALADEFRPAFDHALDHREWKGLVEDMAKWASKTDRLKINGTGGVSLYSGLDPFEAGRILRNWFSMLKKVAESKLPIRSSAEQIKATLQKGTKKGEWEGSGLEAFLQPGKFYTKGEVLAQIDRMIPMFEDVMLGHDMSNPLYVEYLNSIDLGTAKNIEYQKALDEYSAAPKSDKTLVVQMQDRVDKAYWELDEATQAFREAGIKLNDNEPMFSSYVEPGGENYRELFVTAPSKTSGLKELPPGWRVEQSPSTGNWSSINPLGEQEFFGITSREGVIKRTLEKITYEGDWKDGHPEYSDIENPIVRLRMNDRVDSEGKKTLFIEEMQGPSGGDKYDVGSKRFDTRKGAITFIKANPIYSEKDIVKTPTGEQAKMPEALRNRIYPIGVKRALKYAIDNGYDKVAWTTGEMQARRYSLANYVDTLSYSSRSNELVGTYNGVESVRTTLEESELQDYIGVDTAKKLLSAEPNTDNLYRRTIKVDQYIGGQGLRRLYDQYLPNIAKMLGAKMEEVQVEMTDLRSSPPKEKVVKVPGFSLSSFQQGWTPTLYTGLDPALIKQLFAPKVEKFLEFMGTWRQSHALKTKVDLPRILKELKIDTMQALVDQQEGLWRELRKEYPGVYQGIVDRMRSVPAGPGYGGALYEQFKKEVFDGLSNKSLEVLQGYLMGARLTDIYSYKPEYKSQKGYDQERALEAKSIPEMLQGMSDEDFLTFKKSFPGFEKVYGNLTQKDFGDIVRRGQRYFEVFRSEIDRLVKYGVKTPEEGALLKAHDYRGFQTFKIADLIDTKVEQKLGTETINQMASGVVELGSGSSDILETDARVSLQEFMARAEGLIANQKAKMKWEQFAIDVPNNSFVRVKSTHLIPKDWARGFKVKDGLMYVSPTMIKAVAPVTGKLNKKGRDKLKSFYAAHPDSPHFMRTLPAAPKGWVKMPFFKDGVATNLYFAPETAKHLVTRSHDLSHRLTTVLSTMSGAKMVRYLAVNSSPTWATFVGVPMDVLHSLATARVWNPNVGEKGGKPVGGFEMVYPKEDPLSDAKLANDIAHVFGDVYNRGPFFMTLMEHGLHMPFLTMRHNRYAVGKRPPGAIDELSDLLSYIGVTDEITLRAAVARRVMINLGKERGVTIEEILANKEKYEDLIYEAVHAARDRLDYNQGGWLIKAVNNVVPFLNAATLATRTYYRSARDNPMDFTMWTMKLAILATAITAASQLYYKDVVQDIPDEGNESNFVMPLMPRVFNFTDKDGNTRYLYFKVRMEPGVAVSYKIFQALTETYLYDKGLTGKEPDYRKLMSILNKLGPVDLGMQIPITAAIESYRTNYQAWAGRQMYTDLQGRTLPWPESRKEGVNDPNVSQWTKDLGQVTGLSPDRLEGALGNILPRNNELVMLMTGAYDLSFNTVPDELKESHWMYKMSKVPGLNRILGITQPGYGRRQVAEKVRQELDIENVLKDGAFDFMVAADAWHGVDMKDEITEHIKENAKTDREAEAMKQKYEDAVKLKDLTHRGIWLRLMNEPPAERARMFARQFKSETNRGRGQMIKELGHVQVVSPGFMSDEFIEELGLYVKDEEPNERGRKKLGPSFLELMIQQQVERPELRF